MAAQGRRDDEQRRPSRPRAIRRDAGAPPRSPRSRAAPRRPSSRRRATQARPAAPRRRRRPKERRPPARRPGAPPPRLRSTAPTAAAATSRARSRAATAASTGSVGTTCSLGDRTPATVRRRHTTWRKTTSPKASVKAASWAMRASESAPEDAAGSAGYGAVARRSRHRPVAHAEVERAVDDVPVVVRGAPRHEVAAGRQLAEHGHGDGPRIPGSVARLAGFEVAAFLGQHVDPRQARRGRRGERQRDRVVARGRAHELRVRAGDVRPRRERGQDDREGGEPKPATLARHEVPSHRSSDRGRRLATSSWSSSWPSSWPSSSWPSSSRAGSSAPSSGPRSRLPGASAPSRC